MDQERRRQSDRELEELFTLAKQTRDQVALINGHVRRHNEEIFGNGNAAGLRYECDEFHDFMISSVTSVKTVITLVSVFGVANIVALIIAVTRT